MVNAAEAGFNPVSKGGLVFDTFDLISRRWMLVTAGGPGGWNTMTASWGGLGHLWNRDVCFVFVRPQRHTRRFMDESDLFTVSFFGEEQRAALEFCGSHSGRNVDKAASTGLLPFEPAPGCVSFRQAELVLAARTIYSQDILRDGFLDVAPLELYPTGDFHRMYVGEITAALARSGS